MATNQDFNQLVTRIDTATDALEVATGVVVDAGVGVTKDAEDARQAALQATEAASTSTTNANTATQAANTATTKATETTQALNEAKALAPFQEAPKNGSVYGRSDGVWTLVESSGGGGVGTVVSVNGVAPDVQGNVTLDIPNAQVQTDWNASAGIASIKNKPTLFNGAYSSLTGKPTIPSNTNQLVNGANFIPEAPSDSEQYARKNGAWTKVVSGGATIGYPVLEVPFYNSQTMTNWLRPNPFEPLQLSLFGDYVDGEFVKGAELISKSGLASLPSGNYYFGGGDFLKQPVTINITGSTGVTALGNKNGILEVRATIPLPIAGKKILTAYVLSDDFEIIETWHLNTTTFEWVQEGVAEPIEPTPQEPATLIVNKRTGSTFEEWIGTQAQYDLVTPKDPKVRYWITEV